MVLPQTLAPGAQKESGSVKAGSGKDSSQYESVSRAEQKRMDRQQADRSEGSRPSDKPVAEQESKPAEKGQSDTDAPEDGAPVTAPLTFADLQALLTPAAGQGATNTGATATSAGTFSTPGVLTQTMPGIGLAGMSAGQPGPQGQEQAGLTSGLKLTEALTGTFMSNERQGADTTSLITPARFHTAMDMATQQATKLSADAAVPLKGYATSIDLPVGHADWGDKMAGKLSWLTARNMSVAEIHLTPPDMGPMDVKVKLHHDQATITVHAANPMVRDQLELNSHRLRDMLADQGVALAQFDVSDSPQQQGGEQAEGGHQGSGGQNAPDAAPGTEPGDVGLSAGHLDLSWKGEVDIFA
jgi:flagellar hook-length control protein FliK